MGLIYENRMKRIYKESHKLILSSKSHATDTNEVFKIDSMRQRCVAWIVYVYKTAADFEAKRVCVRFEANAQSIGTNDISLISGHCFGMNAS